MYLCMWSIQGPISWESCRAWNPVSNFCSDWRRSQMSVLCNADPVLASFEFRNAFQIDYRCGYMALGGMRQRQEVAYTKLIASRPFFLVEYFNQSYEMLFEAYSKFLGVFGGVIRRSIYDSMSTAEDSVGKGKQHRFNVRFECMTGHYLLEAEFCRRATGLEQGGLEKSMQYCYSHIQREATAETRCTRLNDRGRAKEVSHVQ